MESCQVDLKALYCKVMLMSLNVLPETLMVIYFGDMDLIAKTLKYVVNLIFYSLCPLCKQATRLMDIYNKSKL